MSLTFALSITLAPFHSNADAIYGDYWVGGRIEVEYLNRGGPSVVGLPLTPESDAARGGKFQVFSNQASIYWHPLVADAWAKLVGGAIRDKWAEWGWENGALMYPTSSEFSVKDNGRGNHFEGGSIYWKASTGAHPVWGAIRDQWIAQGWENGPLGYPITDEYEIGGGFQQQFEGGTLSVNVGPEGDDDPNGTNPIIGADDPYNIFAGRYITTTANSGTLCSSKDAQGRSLCVSEGTGEIDPTIAAAPPEAEEEVVPPTDTPDPTTAIPAPSSESERPASTPPTATITVPSSPSVSIPEQTSSVNPSSEPVTPSPTSSSRQPAATTTTSQQPSPAPQNRPFPVRGQNPPVGVPEPQNPVRDTASEDAFFGENRLWCTDKTLNGVFGKRFAACQTRRYAIHYLQEYNGVNYSVGWEKGFIYIDVKASLKSQTVNQRIQYERELAIGTAGAATVTINMAPRGQQGHTGSVSPSGDVTKAIATGASFQFALSSNLALKSNKWERLFTTATATYIDPMVPIVSGGKHPKRIYDFPSVRCDTYTYIYTNDPGCVMSPGETYSKNYPVMDLTTTSVWSPQLYDHVLNAQHSGLPGSPVGASSPLGSARPLQRLPWAGGLHGKNRAIACPGGKAGYNKPAPASDWECDEYPFASTKQGGLSDPTGGRTYNWCSITALPILANGVTRPTGFSACFIPKNQNQAGGRLIRPFTRENRILYESDDPSDGYFVNGYHL